MTSENPERRELESDPRGLGKTGRTLAIALAIYLSSSLR